MAFILGDLVGVFNVDGGDTMSGNTPTDILLSNNIITENLPINTIIGILSSVDIDIGDSFIYTLVSGVGDDDNSSFNINGNELRSSEVFFRDTKYIYTVRIRTTDQNGLFVEKAFTILVEYEYVDTIIDSESIGSLSGGQSVINVSMDNPTTRALYNKDLAMTNNTEITDLDSLIQNMWNILFTEPRERLFNPLFGSRISFKTFDLMSDETEDDVLDILEEDIKNFEPRLTVIRGQGGSVVNLDPSNNAFTVLLVLQGQGLETRTVSFTKEQ